MHQQWLISQFPKQRQFGQFMILEPSAQTLMLSATNRGVDSMVAYENIKYPDEIRENLDIKEEELIIAGIALGYRSEDKINTFTNSRLATEEILTIK